jgi:alanyl-tRNA synthetase
MLSNEIRKRYLEFFKKRGHAVIPSASLIPENDPSSLFTTAGMQPLVPYLLGAKHPAGTRLVDVQKCVRTGDIEDVGDNRHLTFFEMLGNWSLGDYFKEDAIKWSLEFLTSKEEGLGLDPNDLCHHVSWRRRIPRGRFYKILEENSRSLELMPKLQVRMK